MQSNPLQPGTVLARRYEIERVIGAGGMGAVYAARDHRFRSAHRRCAVKEMLETRTEGTARQRARESFEREANLLASMNHRAIPRVYDYFSEDERYYLVYEYVEGQDLARVLAQSGQPAAPEQVVEWMLQLCQVLEALHCHQPPVIFRDLKPSNIMLRPDGQIVLVDFGIAKHFQQVRKGTMVGTEGYAPPEQYEGVATPQVDIYAMGATAHHLLTNTDPQSFRPFSFHLRPVRQYNPAVPAELEAIVMRALAENPAERWQDMRSLATALAQVQKLLTAPRQPVASGLLARLREETAGNNTRPIPPGVAAAPGHVPPHGVPPRLDARPAGTMRVPADQPAAAGAVAPLWSFMAEEEVRSTPEVTADAVYIGSYDTNLYCLDRATGDFRWKFATGGGIPGTPAAVGDLVLVGSEDHRLHAINTRTGKAVWSARTQGRVRSSPRVAMEHAFVGSDDGHVYAFSIERGRLAWKLHLGAPVRSSAAVDEETVYFGSEDGTVAAIDITSGEPRWRVHTGGAVISSPVRAGERIICGSLDRQIYGIDRRSGWVVWRIRLSDRVYSSPFLLDDRIYIAAVDGTIYCIEAEWGHEIWKQRIDAQITSSPVVDEKGRLFIGAVDGTLNCLDAAKGKPLWQFQTDGPVPGSPRVRDGVVYFGSMDHRVYAVPASPPGLSPR